METKALSDQLLQVFHQVGEIRSRGGMSDSRADEELTGQIHDIRKKLATSKEVAEAATNLKEAEQRLSAIEQTIITNDAAIEKLQEQSPDLSELFRKREDLLAEIELGNAEEKNLVALDKEIDDKRRAAIKKWERTDQELDKIDQTVEGLKRKVDIERQNIARLTKELEECSLQAVLGIALDKAELYTKRATETVQLYREITTLSEIVQKHGWGNSFNGFLGKPFERDVLVPALHAPPFCGEYSSYTWKLFDLKHMEFAQQRAIGIRVAEIDELKKAGAVIANLSAHLMEE